MTATAVPVAARRHTVVRHQPGDRPVRRRRGGARPVGPSLAQSGIANGLADPTLELHDANGTLLIANDDWQSDSSSASRLTALGLGPTNYFESAIDILLPPGAFTAILAGWNGGTGIGLVEIYNVP